MVLRGGGSGSLRRRSRKPFGIKEIEMEKLTVEEIRTLQLALDNTASDSVLDSGIQKLMALHNKLDRIADAEQNEHLTGGESAVKMGFLTPEEDAAIKADNKPAPAPQVA